MVILPPSVSKIGESAFENCTDLISVVIMNKDCVIGEDKEDYNNARTICNKYDYTDKIASFEGTIFGFDRPASNEYDDDMGHYSTAEIFADTYHYDFDSINFTPEVDEWGITNSYEYFGDKYFENVETPEDLDNVFIGLDEPSYDSKGFLITNTERYRIYLGMVKQKEEGKSVWTGSCYGMSVTSILSCYGILKPEENGYYKTLNEIDSLDKDIKALINYHHALQYTDYICQLKANAGKEEVEEADKLKKLINCLDDGLPTLLLYYGYFENLDTNGGHAVVAYGHVKGEYGINKKKYDNKILIYDPDYNAEEDPDSTLNKLADCGTKKYDDYCLYYNSDNYSWTIPVYGLDSEKGSDYEHDRSKLGLVIDDIEVINYHGKQHSTPLITKYEHFFPILESTSNYDSLNNVFGGKIAPLVKKAHYNNRAWNTVATADDYIVIDNSDIADETAGDIALAMSDPDMGYIVSLEKPEQFGLLLSYENSLMHANATAGSEVRFDPSSCVSVGGEKTDYELEIVLNDGYKVNDWYDLTVAGSGVNEATLEKVDNGYIINATNLKNVSVMALSDDSTVECVFSTKYPEVFLFETDEHAIGAAVDTDNNGTYETQIKTQKVTDKSVSAVNTTTKIYDITTTTTTTVSTPHITAPTLGDVNSDGLINAVDASIVLTYYAMISTNKTADFAEAQKKSADIDNNGDINAVDASYILSYYAYTSTSLSEAKTSLDEYMIKNI